MTRTIHCYETYTFKGMNENGIPNFEKIILIGDTTAKANSYAKRNGLNATADENAQPKTLVTKMSDEKWLEFCEMSGIYDGHINPATIKQTATDTDTENA